MRSVGVAAPPSDHFAVPTTLRWMRLNRRLTLSALAQRIEVDLAWVANREAGRAVVRRGAVASFASALACPPARLVRSLNIREVGMERADRNRGARELAWIRSEGALLSDVLDRLIGLLGMALQPPVAFAAIYDGWVHDYAQEVRGLAGVTGPLGDMGSVLQQLGLVTLGSRRRLAGTAVGLGTTTPFVLVDSTAPPHVQRLAMLREFARLSLPAEFRATEAGDRLANDCALAIIAPYDSFLSVLSSGPAERDQLYRLCHRWGVGPRPFLDLAQRREDLTRNQARHWVSRLNRDGSEATPVGFGVRPRMSGPALADALHQRRCSEQEVVSAAQLFVPELSVILGAWPWRGTAFGSHAGCSSGLV